VALTLLHVDALPPDSSVPAPSYNNTATVAPADVAHEEATALPLLFGVKV
jgi:hypothetical protein